MWFKLISALQASSLRHLRRKTENNNDLGSICPLSTPINRLTQLRSCAGHRSWSAVKSLHKPTSSWAVARGPPPRDTCRFGLASMLSPCAYDSESTPKNGARERHANTDATGRPEVRRKVAKGSRSDRGVPLSARWVAIWTRCGSMAVMLRAFPKLFTTAISSSFSLCQVVYILVESTFEEDCPPQKFCFIYCLSVSSLNKIFKTKKNIFIFIRQKYPKWYFFSSRDNNDLQPLIFLKYGQLT